MILSGLKKYPLDLTAIVVMFDSGGSSGKLKDELDTLPMGDIRQCLLSLADENILTKIFHYRFDRGSLKGHNLGNIFLAALEKTSGGVDRAIERVARIFNIKKNNRVIPITLEKADIKVVLKNGEEVCKEENIINCRNLSEVGVKKISLEPEVSANPKALLAIKKADLIVIGPGKFYTSIVPNFLVKGVVKAIIDSLAKKVYICNLMTQTGNTDSFTVSDFAESLENYLGRGVIDHIIFNTGRLGAEPEKEVKKAFPGAEFVKYDKTLSESKKFIGADLLDRRVQRANPADVLVKGANKRTMVFHETNKLAKIIFNLCQAVYEK